jgi:hypothetical protein
MSQWPTIHPAHKITAQLKALLAPDPDNRTDSTPQRVENLGFDLEGILHERHRGWTRAADGRVPYLKRGVTMRNSRQVSIVSVEELSAVAARLGLTQCLPQWLHANMVFEGLPQLSFLPRGTKLMFEGGLVLTVEDQNPPCPKTAASLAAANPDRADLKVRFVASANRLRGIVACVEHPGRAVVGATVTARLPEQWIYSVT